MPMLNSPRASRTCTWGCCGDRLPSRTLRTREKRAAQAQARQEQADQEASR